MIYINIDLTHNCQMVDENYRRFISIEWNIPDNVKQWIELLCQASICVLTIHAILKEEFDNHIIWMYNNIYNFIYQMKGFNLEKKELDAEEFIKILENFKYNNEEFLYFIDINENTNRLEQVIWIFPK